MTKWQNDKMTKFVFTTPYHLNVGGGRPSISHTSNAWACSFSSTSFNGSVKSGAANGGFQNEGGVDMII